MESRIATIGQRKLLGKRMVMALTDNKTSELWRGFMSNRKAIQNAIGSNLYSVQVYGPAHFDAFNPATTFEKWATVEVSDFAVIPAGMEALTVPAGQYAVFLHKGAASTGPASFRYIFEIWLPNSAYELDSRPHFEVLGSTYRNDDPTSEEEIWIPIRSRRSASLS